MPKNTFDQENAENLSAAGGSIIKTPGEISPSSYTVNWQVLDSQGNSKIYKDSPNSRKPLNSAVDRAEWVMKKFPKSRIWLTKWVSKVDRSGQAMVKNIWYIDPPEWVDFPPPEDNIVFPENKQRFVDMFSKISLNESSMFKNIVALNKGDIKFLEDVGLYIIEGFKGDVESIIKSATLESNLFEQLQKQSQLYVKSHEFVYWNQPEDKIEEDIEGYHLATLEPTRLTKGRVLKKKLDPKRVVLYFPLLEDWITYYMRNNKESLERQLLLKCLGLTLKNQRMLKYILVNGSKEEMVDDV